jgi:cytochrome bd ubiquinol oxidase subunit II
MTIDLAPLWALILGVSVFFYVLLDGFDLGAGILYSFAPDRTTRNLIMNTVAPIWDGNETWLIMPSVGLLAAFPLAFSIIIPAVYFPILVMLLALIFRGVAFEFHFKGAKNVTFWDRAFSIGSLIATFSQGIVLGAIIQGFSVEGRHFIGSSFECFKPFSIFTGLGLIFGYGLLGAGWLILKTEGELQRMARRQGRICFIGVILAIALVSLWTPMMDSEIRDRWFSWPNIAFLFPVPIITLVIMYYEWRALHDNGSEVIPFVGAIGLFFMSYLGIAISRYPMIIPHHFTIWQTSSSLDTQVFLLLGTVFLLPIILIYSAWSYWVFRGKVRAEIGYS